MFKSRKHTAKSRKREKRKMRLSLLVMILEKAPRRKGKGRCRQKKKKKLTLNLLCPWAGRHECDSQQHPGKAQRTWGFLWQGEGNHRTHLGFLHSCPILFFPSSSGCLLTLLMGNLMRLSVNGSWILFLPQVIIKLSNFFPLTCC
jgi:hypothetical protein